MINLKALIFSIAIPLGLGFIGNLLGNSNAPGFDSVIQPSFTPPAILFPIVWTILYTLMGISSYLIYVSDSDDKKSALLFYGIQLIFNTLWSFIFFRLQSFLFAFIWLITLIILVGIMIYKFYKINKISSYLQIPYLLWLLFAGILNFSVYWLNK